METDRARTEELLDRHKSFSGGAESAVFQAPGRVNLLGEHTDYSGGFCMPAALSFNTLIAASSRADGKVRLNSLNFGEVVELDLANLGKGREEHWSQYCAGVAWALLGEGVKLRGGDLSITGNVPLGSSLSSSASIEVATAMALLGLAEATLPKAKVALLCQKAENEYVHSPCGIMDQFIAANGVKDHALALDTRALTFELAPIPESLRLVVSNSMVKHSVATGEYGTRRREVEEAARVLGEADPRVKQLRDATLEQLNASRGAMSDEAFKRARHVITDSGRVLEGLAALRAGDEKRFGEIMVAAHASYRDDFAASCRECDLLVELALKIPGCLGARLTGGGFGGCTVNLVEAGQSESFAGTLREEYRAATGVMADVFICETADGAGPVAAG